MEQSWDFKIVTENVKRDSREWWNDKRRFFFSLFEIFWIFFFLIFEILCNFLLCFLTLFRHLFVLEIVWTVLIFFPYFCISKHKTKLLAWAEEKGSWDSEFLGSVKFFLKTKMWPWQIKKFYWLKSTLLAGVETLFCRGRIFFE